MFFFCILAVLSKWTAFASENPRNITTEMMVLDIYATSKLVTAYFDDAYSKKTLLVRTGS